MHENGIKAQIKSKYKPQMTKADSNEQAYPNLLEQDFKVTESNKVWLSDITYIRVNGKWACLAAVMNLGRRKIVGWSLGTSPNAALACRALQQALPKEQPAVGLIHHSDRGCQYTSKLYKRLLDSNGIFGRMSRKGNPYDNAPMESFFQTLKTECVYKQSFTTIEQASYGLKQWINMYCNCRRRHSALSYKSPLFYEITGIHPFNLSAKPVTAQTAIYQLYSTLPAGAIKTGTTDSGKGFATAVPLQTSSDCPYTLQAHIPHGKGQQLNLKWSASQVLPKKT